MAIIYWKVDGTTLKLRSGSASGYSDFDDEFPGAPDWAPYINNVTKIIIENNISPSSMYAWFIDCSKVTEIQYIQRINTSNVTNMEHTFDKCKLLTSLDLSSFNTSNVTDMTGMFRDCNSLTSLDLSSFNTSRVTDMGAMFYNCQALTSLNLSNFNTSNVTDMSYMFYNCRALTSLNLSGFNTSNVTNMYCMFQNCWALTTLDVSGFNTSKVVNMSYMFDQCLALTSLDVSHFDTSKVTEMAFMFNQCRALISLDLSGFDTSNVTDMRNMFTYCYALTSLDLSSFNTSNVTYMNSMFIGCYTLTSLNLSSFNTSNVNSMNSMFGGCSALTSLDLSNFNTSNVTNMMNMFMGCSALRSLDLSNFNTSNVVNMRNMFSQCSVLTSLNLSNFDTSNVTNMDSMFDNCQSLTTIIISSALFKTTQVTSSSDMFTGCTNLIGGRGTPYDSSYIDKTYARGDDAPTTPGYFTGIANCASFDSTDGTLEIFYTGTSHTNGEVIGTKTYYTNIDQVTGTTYPKWYSIRDSITKIIIEDLFKPKTGYCLFSSISLTSIEFFKYNVVVEPNITDINLYYEYNSETETYFLTEDQTIREKTYYTRLSIFDTSNVINMSFMFYKCQVLTELDLSDFDTSNVTSMNSMFAQCYALTSLNLSSFNTSNVTNMSYMFQQCRALISLNVSNFNTSNVLSMNSIFSSCYALTSLDLSNFDTSNVTNMSFMFNQCYALTSLDLSDFNTSNVTNMQAMFQKCYALTRLDISNFNTSNVTNMAHIFNECHALTTLTLSLSFNTSNVTNMTAMFQQCYVLTSLDVSHFDTSNVTNMSYMFNRCYVLTSPLDVSGFNTSNVTDMSYMFAKCSALTSLDVSDFDTSNVTNMEAMFDTCYALASLNVSSFNTSNVTNMGYMFIHCHALTPLNVSGFNTSNVTNMSHMFQSCYALTSLNVSNFDTSKVTDMGNMFGYCPLLTTLDISNFVFSNSADISGMFEGCTSLAGAMRINSNPGSYTDMFKDTVEEIVLFGNSTLLNSFTTTANNHNVYVWSLSVQPRAERDKEVGDSVNFSVEITRFAGNQGEIEIEATVNDVSVPLTWNEPLIMDTNRKTFTASLANVDENASITYTFVVEDIYGKSLPRSITVPTNYYTIDFLKGGKEISFGEKADIDDFYELLTEKPEDWRTNFNNYYRKVGEDYKNIEDTTEPQFNVTDFYQKIHESLFKCSMDTKFKDMEQVNIDDFLDNVVPGTLNILNTFYPIGSYYETTLPYAIPSGESVPTEEDMSSLGLTWFNPNYAWGGTWALDDEYELVAWLSVNNNVVTGSKNMTINNLGTTSANAITFLKPMKDVNYLVAVSGEASGIASEILGVYTKSVNGFYLDHANYSGTAVVLSYFTISVFGRLANPEKFKWYRTV